MKYQIFFSLLILALLASCGTFEVSVGEPASAGTTSTINTEAAPPTPVPEEQPILVAYVQDGNIQLWDERTQQSKTVFASGDVSLVSMSGDGLVIAFTRRTRIEQPELMEQFSLWAVNQDGSNPRQLVAPEALGERLNPSETQTSTGFAQLEWLPGSHRLAYSLVKYYLVGQGSTYSQDIYVVDADSGADDVVAANVVSAEGPNVLKMIPSPDGARLALLSMSSLSFVSTDGGDRRENVLTYTDVFRGDEPAVLTSGAWTRDASAFIIAAPDSVDEQFSIGLTIWRVPVDGGSPEALASVERSHPLSITFSPTGDHFAYAQYDDPAQPPVYLISALSPSVGPLALPSLVDFSSYTSLHWSPDNEVFTHDLIQLCPGATSDADKCERKFELGSNNIQSVRWMDGSRLVVLTREPPVLFYAVDNGQTGTALPIVAWGQPEQSHSYWAAFNTP